MLPYKYIDVYSTVLNDGERGKSVGTEPKKPEKEKKEREKEPVNVERLVTSFLSLATTALTDIVLSKQL